MFAYAELTMTLDAVPDADDLAGFIARAVENGLVVTGAGPSSQNPDRFAVTVTTGPQKRAMEVQKIFDRLMKAVENIK
jgi:hypothetical protein